MDLSGLYRDIVESSPDGLWVIDLDGRTVYANPEIARLHRIADEGLAALTVFDILDEDGRAQFRAHLDEVRKGPVHDHPVDVKWVRNDGTVQWMLCSETVLLDDAGRPRALLHRYSDNTERHELIASLQAARTPWRTRSPRTTSCRRSPVPPTRRPRSARCSCRPGRWCCCTTTGSGRGPSFPSPDGTGHVEPFYPVDEDREKDAGDPRRRAELVLAQRAHDARGPVWDEAQADPRVPDPAHGPRCTPSS